MPEIVYDPVLGYGVRRQLVPTYHQLCGGFVLDLNTIVEWGSRLADVPCSPDDPVEIDIAKYAVKAEVKKHKPAQLLAFGNYVDWEPYGLMIVTQSKYSKEPLDIANLPQFERGERERVAEELLKQHGVKNYEFRTVFR